MGKYGKKKKMGERGENREIIGKYGEMGIRKKIGKIWKMGESRNMGKKWENRNIGKIGKWEVNR